MLATHSNVVIGAGLGEMRAYTITLKFTDGLTKTDTVCLSDYDELLETIQALKEAIEAVESRRKKRKSPHTFMLHSLAYCPFNFPSNSCDTIIYEFGNSSSLLTYTQSGHCINLSGLRSWYSACTTVRSAYDTLLQGPESDRMFYEYPDIDRFSAALDIS
jgi:hypothetical protein